MCECKLSEGAKAKFAELDAFIDGLGINVKDDRRRGYLIRMLEYIARNCIGQEFDATVVRQEGNLVLAEIDKLFERGVVYTRDHVRFGERIRVKIKDSSPKNGRLAMEMLN